MDSKPILNAGTLRHFMLRAQQGMQGCERFTCYNFIKFLNLRHCKYIVKFLNLF